MSDTDFELSRRKALAALGTIGVASAGAGLGTSAYFSDGETFENNRLVAGTLDLRVGWESHYSDWSADEDDGIDGGVAMGNDKPVGLPTQESSLISVDDVDDARRFLNNTEVDQHPDGPTGSFDDAGTTNGCSVLPEGTDQSPVVVDLDDVKPGDFGEVTFALALCDNPGYLWMNGDLRSADEAGTTEPEADDPDEGEGVELLDTVRTAVWYDDGDNLQSGGGDVAATDVDVVLTLDNSNSIGGGEKTAIANAARTFIDLLSASSQSATVSFAAGSNLLSPLTTDKEATKSAITTYENQSTIFQTRIGEGIRTARQELEANGNPDADDIIVVLSDGAPFPRGGGQAGDNTLLQADVAKSAGIRIVSLGFGIETFAEAEAYLQAIAGTTPDSEADFDDGPPYDDEGDYFEAPTTDDLEAAFTDIAGTITEGEEILFQGTLREMLGALSDGRGIPLDGNRMSAFDEVGDPADSPDRECFDGTGVVHYLGFAWWLPVDHGNEVQSDSVTFDLGFYTEQCRHNDGAGMPPETE